MKKMKGAHPLQALINARADVWRGSSASKQQLIQVQSSLYPVLDALLPKQGWPINHLCELYFPRHGIGELQLLMPALEQLQKQNPHLNLCMINPPFRPYISAMNFPSLLQISSTHDLWATEECLTSGTCFATLLWLTKVPNHTQLRRLQLSAKRGQTWCVLMYATESIPSKSAASLRIQISPLTSQYPWQHDLSLHILKKPLGWAGQRCQLQLHSQSTAPAPHLINSNKPENESKIHRIYTPTSPLSQETIPSQISTDLPQNNARDSS
jgi:hypothetical protein